MTSQPDSPTTDRMGIDEDAMDATQDPDLVIVAGEVVAEDADPDATETDTESDIEGGYDLAASDLGTSDLAPRDLAPRDLTGSDLSDREDNIHPADLGQQWHDIQAMFVDDPRGSVELAAAAAGAALGALVETLHQRQSALAPAGSTSADPGGTEQLREALRSYRLFCQSLAEIGQHLAQPTTMTQ